MSVHSRPVNDNCHKTILVVCTGNLFRSPVAAAFIRDTLCKADLSSQVKVISAGMDARAGNNLPVRLVEHMQSTYSIDLSLQRVQSITFDLFQSASLVLVMEQQHLERLSKQYPRQSHKIRYISELSGKVYDIIDPVVHPEISLFHLTEELKTHILPNLVTLLKWLKLN